MRIYLKQSTSIDKAKLFLMTQILTVSAKQQGHEIVSEEPADLIMVLGNTLSSDVDLVGKKVFFADLEETFNAPEQVLVKAVSEAKIYTSNENGKALFSNKNKKIVAVTACPTGVVRTFMTAEAIAEFAKKQGWEVKVETRGQVGANNLISEKDVEEADLVFIATDIDVDLSKFKGKLMYHTSTELALKDTAEEFDKAFKTAIVYNENPLENPNQEQKAEDSKEYIISPQEVKHIVAVTACPTGVVRTFMTAEAIAEFAKKQGWTIKVETRGQVGANNLISPEDVAKADLVFIATDIDVDLSKFKDKLMYHTSTELALKKTAEEFEKAFKKAHVHIGK